MTGIVLGLNQDEVEELVAALQQRERCLAAAECCDDGPSSRDAQHHRLIVQSLLDLVVEAIESHRSAVVTAMNQPIPAKFQKCTRCGTMSSSGSEMDGGYLCGACLLASLRTVQPTLRTIRRG